MADSRIIELIDRLEKDQDLPDSDLLLLLQELKNADQETEEYLYKKADGVRREIYGTDVYLRGLIEFTNHCKNDCYYCGIRRSNTSVERYRLTKEEILECCKVGYSIGYRTFVLQGGEDAYFTDDRVCEIVSEIKEKYPDCAITLSIGEKDRESYQRYFDAGAERYLLRHETADFDHYRMLHPEELSAEHRQNCLRQLKEIGYQIGCGIMVGAPGQRDEHILADIRFMQELQPHMIGIGPFIPAAGTPMEKEPSGTLEDTLHLLSVLRLLFPQILLPATTALGTIHPIGREMGVKAGANVVMPNLSPTGVRDKYLLYDGKICTGDRAEECRHCMEGRMKRTGYQVVVNRGDYPGMQPAAE